MLVVGLLLVGCHLAVPLSAAPGAPRKAALAESVPVDPGIAPSPYDAVLEEPDLTKRASDLDLESLGWRYTTYHVEVDLSVLGKVTAERSRDLMVRLGADPRWRVGVWDGAVVAFQRSPKGAALGVPRHGYHVEGDSVWRTAVRFTPWSRSSEWASDQWVASVPATQRRLDLRAFELLAGPAKGLEATALTVQGAGVALDLFEATEDQGRPRTATALSELPSTLEGLLGSSWKGLAYDPGRFETPNVDLRSAGKGMLEVRGRVAAQAPGWTWLRVLDARGRPWEEAATAAGTRELVWGTADEVRNAYVQSQFPVPSGPAFTGTAEVWYSPLDGGTPERLAAYPLTIPAR